ncbi:aminopeptidase [Pelovirga terrestris]|uniref:Aminopeptidase n=1 Tax=Pelovirga terrestris TaxID=2771352 RepID=A0A8J6UIR8_9BACT|nr:aminopeptidase [Pelovirga terrestris]MBD1401580.1 aminopeptidase [Pelovirga terrestris]
MCLLLIGCGEINYYRQAALGQWHLLAQRHDIEELLAADQTPADLKQRLELVQSIRDFAGTELLLPDNRSYRTYADLKRPYAVWNVVAAPSLSVDPLTWCFPVAGCVPYRGYFDEAAAHHFAQGLKAKGYDVHVYGVSAYSTLNWFDDPVLNTFIHYPEDHLAGLIFHELAHQQLYLKDDSPFNESFARMVELVGVERWLVFRQQQDQISSYRQQRARQQEFIDLVLQTRRELEAVYHRNDATSVQLTSKEQLLREFRQGYTLLKQQWGGDERFDAWVNRPLNNSHFALVATYHDYVPAFFALLEQSDGDLQAFYRKATELADLPLPQRDAALRVLRPAVTEDAVSAAMTTSH